MQFGLPKNKLENSKVLMIMFSIQIPELILLVVLWAYISKNVVFYLTRHDLTLMHEKVNESESLLIDIKINCQTVTFGTPCRAPKQDSESNTEILPHKKSKIINKMARKLNCRIDGIPAKVLKNTPDIMLFKLSHVFNLSLSTGIFLESLKKNKFCT